MISKRIKTIADYVPNNSNVIDVGCDHALLDISLVKKNNCKCIAIDKISECIEVSSSNVLKNKLTNQIKVIKNDGLKGIEYHSNTHIVLAGLGYRTILKIDS